MEILLIVLVGIGALNVLMLACLGFGLFLEWLEEDRQAAYHRDTVVDFNRRRQQLQAGVGRRVS